MAERQLQIYLVTSQTSQKLIAGLLAGFTDVAVDVVSSDFDHFVVVECAGGREAVDVRRRVRAIDPDVRLIHTSTPQPREPTVA